LARNGVPRAAGQLTESSSAPSVCSSWFLRLIQSPVISARAGQRPQEGPPSRGRCRRRLPRPSEHSAHLDSLLGRICGPCAKQLAPSASLTSTPKRTSSHPEEMRPPCPLEPPRPRFTPPPSARNSRKPPAHNRRGMAANVQVKGLIRATCGMTPHTQFQRVRGLESLMAHNPRSKFHQVSGLLRWPLSAITFASGLEVA
jgi:hypothetical protein